MVSAPFPKSLLTVVPLVSLIPLLGACSEITKIQTQNQYLHATLRPGLGFGDINLGSTSLREISAQLGRNYKRNVREGSISECVEGVCKSTRAETITLNYKKHGFLFVFEQRYDQFRPEPALPLREIHVKCINQNCPYQGKTEQGIGLGDTRKRLQEVYGDPKRSPTNTWQWSYPRKGITFGIDHKQSEPIRDRDRINTIIISNKR